MPGWMRGTLSQLLGGWYREELEEPTPGQGSLFHAQARLRPTSQSQIHEDRDEAGVIGNPLTKSKFISRDGKLIPTCFVNSLLDLTPSRMLAECHWPSLCPLETMTVLVAFALSSAWNHHLLPLCLPAQPTPRHPCCISKEVKMVVVKYDGVTTSVCATLPSP